MTLAATGAEAAAMARGKSASQRLYVAPRAPDDPGPKPPQGPIYGSDPELRERLHEFVTSRERPPRQDELWPYLLVRAFAGAAYTGEDQALAKDHGHSSSVDAAKTAGRLTADEAYLDLIAQANNALVFPGLFRGALDVHSRRIDDGMKIAAAAQAVAMLALAAWLLSIHWR